MALFALASSVEAGWYNPSWGYRKVIVVNGKPDAGDCGTGTCVAGALTSFPVLVSLASDADLAARAQDDGDDILFTDGTGNTKLDHEIESFDGATGALVAWVRLPSLSATANTTIYLYYGNAGAANQQNAAGVWDTNAKAVWHLKESSTGTAGEFKDSTSNNNHGQGRGCVGLGAGPPTRTTGQIGYGQQLYCQWIEVPDTTTTLQITGTITLEAWIYANSWNNGDHSSVVARQFGTGAADSYQLGPGPSAGASSTPFAWMTSGFVTGGTVNTLTWHHLAVTVSGTNSYIYVNGVQTAAAGGLTITNTPGNPVTIGAQYNGGVDPWQGWDGRLDEVRISNAVRTPQWIQTSYNNGAYQGVGANQFIFFVGPEQTTAVTLMSFTAAGVAGGVELSWRTGSELDNLGFYLYRSPSPEGPWTRLNASLIPGLGSSALGQAYSYLDTGLGSGTRYYYRLEDVDASSKVTSHGPVSAVPLAGATPTTAPGGPSATKRSPASAPACPAWVASAYGALTGSAGSASALPCTRHGDPEAVSLAVIAKDARSATLELRTGGFYAVHEAAGTVRVFVPGFDHADDAKAPALPFRRALVEAVVGRRAQLGAVRALEPSTFAGLVPSALGQAEMQVSTDGTVRAARRAPRGGAAGGASRATVELARLLPSVFQGETKSAVVALHPLRYDAQKKQLVLAQRLQVRLLFTGREAGETGRASRGRRPPAPVAKPAAGGVLARLHTTSVGLHVASYETLFPGRSQPLAVSRLRLQRQGHAVAFHVEPGGAGFGPGSRLYFYADVAARSTAFSSETAWELVSAGGVAMATASAAPTGAVLGSATGRATFEVNRFYQPGLLEAPDPWLWEAAATGARRVLPFTLTGVDTAGGGGATLDVHLQGGSESGQPVDHHVRVSVNGVAAGEAQFAGKTAYRMSLALPAGLLREGSNELELVNVGDTGVTSLVFLDRFTLAYPELPSLGGGVFDGSWSRSGTAALAGAVGGGVLLDVTAADGSGGAPVWLSRFDTAGGVLRFRVEAGRRYWVGSDSALFSPRVSQGQASGLKSAVNQADWLLIAPRAFLSAAEPLLARRQDQGLTTRAVAFEEIADEFGHGQPSAEAIQAFLAYAYQSWARPSLRYVVLLGDASYDPRRFMATSLAAPLPALWTKTSYLWTASDPLLAAVNGEDSLPDLAIGRLPAQSAEEAQRLIDKLIAWEESGQGLSGPAVLVADNPDSAGDFEANVQDVAQSYLAGRSEVLKLSELGAGTRPAIQAALDSGLSYLGYVGHGGAAVWASENVWNSWDAASLQAQSRQPLLLTLNCLNGYFVAPSYDSLAESLVKAEGRGAIAAFSPSGLSLDEPAHQYHRALMAELTSGTHERLGDAVLAAQQAYARSGLMPELLSIYHLLGDPATAIR